MGRILQPSPVPLSGFSFAFPNSFDAAFFAFPSFVPIPSVSFAPFILVSSLHVSPSLCLFLCLTLFAQKKRAIL